MTRVAGGRFCVEGRAKFASGSAEVTDALPLEVSILGKRVRHLSRCSSIAAPHTHSGTSLLCAGAQAGTTPQQTNVGLTIMSAAWPLSQPHGAAEEEPTLWASINEICEETVRLSPGRSVWGCHRADTLRLHHRAVVRNPPTAGGYRPAAPQLIHRFKVFDRHVYPGAVHASPGAA